MNVQDALRFLEHEASYCREHDSHEALCLLLPAMLRALELEPMNGYEAEEFKRQLRQELSQSRPKPAAPAASESCVAQFKKNAASCAADLWRRFV